MGMATVTRIGTQTDQDIQRDVLNELKWEPRVQPNEIGVGGKDGGGALTGWGGTFTKKRGAGGGGHPGRGRVGGAHHIQRRVAGSARRTAAGIGGAPIWALGAG